jgi:ribulose-phosphate 3-epimerase
VDRSHPALTGTHVLPSVMSSDMLRLGEQIDALAAAGARALHVDVMDNHFVPNLTVGPDFTAAVARAARPHGMLVDVHVMVERPGNLIPLFAPHADAISVHVEADPHPHRLLGAIRDAGLMAGIAINPGTPVEALSALVPMIDYVNCMSVNPGFAGQSFVPQTPAKVRLLRDVVGDGVVIEVDGGVGPSTIDGVRDAGAQWLVSASAIFGSDDPIAAYGDLARGARGE